jgi:RNA polymerase sigma-70 factor (ECF subfamily)
MARGSSRDPIGGEDERCLVAARTDPEAFARLYDRRCATITAYFYRRILCPHTAAELTAETFARLWSTRMAYDPRRGSAMAWTLGIAGNLYRQWSRSGVVECLARSRLGIETPRLVHEDFEHIETLVDIEDLRVRLKEAIDSLTPKLRDAVVLRILDDLPYEEVAARLGSTVGAARVRVSRALDAMQATMEAAP